MRNLVPVLILACLSIIVSCTKDEKEKVIVPPTNFQPFGVGSTWSYADYPLTNLYSVYATGIDSTFNKKKYHEMYSTNTGTSWVLRENGIYYKLLPYLDTVVEFTYLKDNVSAGSTWFTEYEFDGLPTTYLYKIIENDQSKMINGIIYEHCITVREDVLVDFGLGTDSLITSWDYSYANDVGLVYIKRDSLNNDIYLKSCIIK